MKPLLLLALLCLLPSNSLLLQAQEKMKEHPTRDDVTGIPSDDPELLAAYQKARDTLIHFVNALEKPDPQKRYLLKVKLIEGGQTEQVWLEPVRWMEPGLKGVLAVDPVFIKNYKKGDVIHPLPGEVSDWVILSEDGTKEGGLTEDLVQRRRAELEKSKSKP
ncbi:MAG: DUF2314 domain-containing protein [Prosthecobacter sp.]